MTAILSNPMTGETKIFPSGFSWTTLFFGPLPALFRGDIKWVAIMTVADVCTSGTACLVFPFIYNKLYFTDLLKKGFRPVGAAGVGVASGAQQVVQQFHINAGNSSTSSSPERFTRAVAAPRSLPIKVSVPQQV
jgi:hypothetical protein